MKWEVREPGFAHSVDDDTLIDWARSGRIRPNTLIADENGREWQARDFSWIFSSKSSRVLVAVSFLGGLLGLDRIYLGKTRSGILKLLTIGGLGAWWLIDLATALRGNSRDKYGMPLDS